MNTNPGRIDWLIAALALALLASAAFLTWAFVATVNDPATPALGEVPKPSVTITRAMQVTV